MDSDDEREKKKRRIRMRPTTTEESVCPSRRRKFFKDADVSLSSRACRLPTTPIRDPSKRNIILFPVSSDESCYGDSSQWHYYIESRSRRKAPNKKEGREYE